MSPYIILPLFLGVLAVFQPILNKVILDSKGLAFAAWMNSLVLFTTASLTLAFVYFAGDRLPSFLRPRLEGEWHWWFLLPGIFGFLIVFFLPLSMRSLGAFASISAILLGQLLTSFIYDAAVSGKPITIARALGLLFTIVGAYLSFRPAE